MTSLEIVPGVRLRVAHGVKARQGEVSAVVDLVTPYYELELASAVPSIGMPKTTFRFPLGEVSLDRREKEENWDLRYAFKDKKLTFVPSISLPSNVFSCAFKRRITQSDKLRVGKPTNATIWFTNKECGLHTHSREGLYSLTWLGIALGSVIIIFLYGEHVGDEAGKARKDGPIEYESAVHAPKSAALMFRVKKSWDIHIQ
ncbi:outer envelope pore protein 37, chloroplastic-like isoform X1 [Salvia divinorum]|uniref:Outer envelope pore protein 37, chloroplastic-like isoform X1 n=1 Tax=Salvia divinorum TaxID=28513 RepID=A0ABD1HRV4_SALDI